MATADRCQRAKEQHLEWPFLFMAVLSAALLSTGVIRHYVDIWRHKTVRGISFLFIAIDALGDLTSALALGEFISGDGKPLFDRHWTS